MDIKFEPYKRLTIRNYAKFTTVEDFTDKLTLSLPRDTGGRHGALLWAHGVLFRHAPFFPTESMTKEYIEGHLLMDNLEFAPMPDFREEIFTRQYTIPVMDVTNNKVLGELAGWIHDNLLESINDATDIQARPKRRSK